MKKLSVVLFLFAIILMQGQDKYFVYFKDKGITKESFQADETLLKKVNKNLSERAIERRIKKMGDDYIDYDDLPVEQDYIDEVESLGFKIHRVLKWFNAVSVSSDEADIEELNNLSFVDKIEKVGTIKFSYPDESSGEKDSYQLDKTTSTNYSLDYGESLDQSEFHEIPVVHDAGYNGKGVVIGFLDAGFRIEDFSVFDSLEVLYEYDYVNNDENTANETGDNSEQDYHGTAVLSLATGFDEGELIGPAYKASVMLCKTEDIDSETHVEEDNFAAAVEDLEELGVDIITSSLGYSDFDKGEEDYTYEDMDGETTIVTQAYNKAFDKGIVTVNSMGNEGNSTTLPTISAPADAFDVISIGNVNLKNEVHVTSGRGPTYDGRIKPEVVALGTSPRKFYVGSEGYTSSGYGTSYSTPFVAGMIAQLLQAYPYLINEQVRDIVMDSGDNTDDPDNDRGYGLLSVRRMLNQPNLEISQDEVTINKMFLGDSLAGTPSLYLLVDNDWETYELGADGNVYSYDISSPASNNIEFYYKYETTSSETIREPEDENYTLIISDADTSGYYSDLIPAEYELFQNYPNPFNSMTTIEFDSPSEEFAEVIIYDILGREVKKIFSKEAAEGTNKANWDMTNQSGATVASGVYIYALRIEGNIYSKKMMLIK